MNLNDGNKRWVKPTFITVAILISILLFYKRFGGKDSVKLNITQAMVDKVKPVVAKYTNDPYFKSLVNKHSAKYITMPHPSDFLLAQIAIENTDVDYNATGDSGKAAGLMQIHADVAQAYGHTFEQLFDPDVNMEVGTKYMAHHYKTYGTWEKALKRYNGGGDPNYVQKVMDSYKTIRMIRG